MKRKLHQFYKKIRKILFAEFNCLNQEENKYE